MSAERTTTGPGGRTTLWLVTWPAQVAAGRPPEERRSEKAAELRAQELVRLGKGPATFFAVDVEIETEGDVRWSA